MASSINPWQWAQDQYRYNTERWAETWRGIRSGNRMSGVRDEANEERLRTRLEYRNREDAELQKRRWENKHGGYRGGSTGQWNVPPEGYGQSSGGLIENAVKSIYDESKGGMQWGGVIGSLGGLALGGLMGNYIGGEFGGWLGTTATVLLAASGMVMGSKMGNEFLPSSPTPIAVAKGKDQNPQPAVDKNKDAPAPDMQSLLNKPTEQKKDAEIVELTDGTLVRPLATGSGSTTKTGPSQTV